MELQFLGTGAGVPAKHRNVTSIALKLLDERNEVWLFDCGEGTQMQILRTTIRPRKIGKIFITHLHGDHILDFRAHQQPVISRWGYAIRDLRAKRDRGIHKSLFRYFANAFKLSAEIH